MEWRCFVTYLSNDPRAKAATTTATAAAAKTTTAYSVRVCPYSPYTRLCRRLLKVNGRHLYTATYMNMTISSLQCKVAYWPAMTLGGAAQVVAAHYPNERILDPTVCSYNTPTYAPVSRTMAFILQCSLAMTRCCSVKRLCGHYGPLTLSACLFQGHAPRQISECSVWWLLYVWNSLPVDIRNTDCLSSFWSKLKTHLLQQQTRHLTCPPPRICPDTFLAETRAETYRSEMRPRRWALCLRQDVSTSWDRLKTASLPTTYRLCI